MSEATVHKKMSSLYHAVILVAVIVLFQATLSAVAFPSQVAEGAPVETEELLTVVVLFRHGDRTPVQPYPADPYKDQANWPVGFGQLTATGKRMHYELGKYLRKRYGNILRESYNETDIYVRSTDVDRTLMSALSDLAGLYPPKGDQVWNPDLAWQPVPVHTVPNDQDLLLSEQSACPAFQKMVEDLKRSQEVQDIIKPYKWLFDYLSEHTGENVTDINHVDYIYDTLFIERLYNKTLPEWTKAVFPDKMEPLRNLSFKLDSWTRPMKRLKAGPLLKLILDRFERFSAAVDSGNMSSSGPRMTMLSGHDTTVATVLNALDQFDPPLPPPYAAALMVELYAMRPSSKVLGQDPSSRFRMKFLYKNESDREPYLLHLNGCSADDSCTFDEYKRLTDGLRPEDVAAECLLVHEDDMRAEFAAVLTFTIVGVILACMCLALLAALWNRRCRNQETVYGPLQETGKLASS